MAKKKKNQDTSPLSMGRQQKGSAANKRANRTGSSNGSQSSSSSKTVSRVNERASRSTFMGGSSYTSRTSGSSSSGRSSSGSSSSNRMTTQDRINQRSYGTTNPNLTTRRQMPATSKELREQNAQHNNNLKQTQAQTARDRLEADRIRREQESRARRSEAQYQKTNARPTASTSKEMMEQREAARQQKMGLNNMASAKTQKAANRAVENTPALVKKAVQDTVGSHKKTIADVTDLTAERGANAYAQKLGIDTSDARAMAKVKADREKTAEEARRIFEEESKKQDKRQKDWDKRSKGATGLEKAYYGAVESGTGMLTDLALGMGTQAGALAAMGSRTYGQTRGQAQKEGATKKEDRLYSLTQAGKEVGTELMFPGAGLAKKAYGRVGLPLAEKAARVLTKGMRGKAADIASAGLRLAGGVAEENLEEVAGWGLDPIIKEFTYGRNARRRDAEAAMQKVSDSMRADIQNEDDARNAAAYLSSDDFIEQTKQSYMEEGLSETDAEEIAYKMREYLTASLSGDVKTMADIEDEVSKKMAGGLKRGDWSGKELLETIASTTLLTGVTGLPGTINTMAHGAAIRDALGDDGLRALAKTAIDFEDETASIRGEVARDRLNEGKELTATQVYDLAAAGMEQNAKDVERQNTAVSAASTKIEENNLVTPVGVDRNGNTVMGEATAKSYNEEAKAAEAILKDKESITEQEVDDGARAIAGFKTGVFTVDDANALNYSNTEIREAFAEATGIDLNQYIVREKGGTVNIPATNKATKDALFAMASDNLVTSAEAETVNWMDNVKGEVVTQVSARMSGKGSLALQLALDDVDERNRSEYMLTANAADMMYQQGRNIGAEWDTISNEAKAMFPSISENKLRMMYEAGIADREIANNKAIGLQVKMGESMSSQGERTVPGGKVIVETETEPKGTEVRLFSEIANQLGADIHLVDAIVDKDGNVIDRGNGSYDPSTNSFYINLTTGVEQNIGYIFMHECTHYLKVNAPEQYQELENLVREKWFSANPEQMQNAIARKIEAYKAAGQNLTEEQALEEIIADAAHEFINDPNFANQIAEENPSLAKALLDSIRNALRMLRRILSSGTIDDETHMNSLFSELGILDEAEKIWLNAYTQAVKNRADQAINDWQDEVNAESDTRHSLGYHAGDLGKSTVDDYARQGYGRGTGHFGFGTYFVGDEEKINYGDYGKRKHEAVDFDKYNLFKPRNFEQGLKLHDALKLIDGYITQYSEFADVDRFSDEGRERYHDNTSRINRAAENLVDEYEWNDFQWDESTQENKERVDKYIADSLDDYDRSEIESKAQEEYDKAQNQSIDEDAVRKELADHYDTFKNMTDFWGNPFVSEASEEEYIENHLQDTIDIRNSNKDVPYDYYYYKQAQEAIKTNSEKWEWTEGKLGRLADDLMSALGYKHRENEIKDALKETERIVGNYAYNGSRMNAERGLDSGATVFMKQLGYEGVDVRHINEMDNTEYGSVIYDLKDEDLARKQEIGTARFSISDAEYMDAVERGDMEEAQRMVDEAAKNAMPNSKLIQDGKFYKMWHHTSDEFTSFLPGTSTSSGGLKGIYFTPQESSTMANLGAKHDQYYLNVTNPKFAFGVEADKEYVETLRKMQKGVTDREELERINRQFVEETGVDAFFDWQNGWYNILTPEQIKSADPVVYDDNGNVIPLSERFNQENPDIRYSLSSSFEAVGCNIRKENGLLVATDSQGKEIKEFTPEYIKKSPLGRVLTMASSKAFNVLSDADVNAQVNFLSSLYNMILNTQDPDLIWAVSGTIGYDPRHLIDENTPQEWVKEQKSKFASITGNADPQYKTTIDFTTICVKTQAVIDAMSKVMMDLGRGLSEHEIIDIVYNETAMAGEQVPCPVCYVFSRWVGLGNLFGKIKQFQTDYPEDMDMTDIRAEYESIKKDVDAIVREMTGKKSSGKARDKIYAETIARKDALDLKDQMPNKELTKAERKELEDINRRLEVLDHWSWLEKTRLQDDYKAVPDEVLFDINAGRKFATEYPATWRFRTTRGPSLGKAAAPYSPSRLGDTIRGIASPSSLKKLGESKRVFLNEKGLTTTARKAFKKAVENAKKQNRMNGQRLQSTSDFRFEYGLDYLLSFIELGAIGAKAQMYTKVPEAVKFLASTGAEVNCSIMPKGRGLDKNGKLIFSDITGMAWEDALALSKAYDNVQPILVAIGRDHLIAAMASDDITMIIPYHASGSSEHRYRSMMDTVGESVEDRTDFADYENEHDIEDATPEQKLCRKLRVDLLMGKKQTLNDKEKAALAGNEILRQLYIRVYGKDENGKATKPDPKYVENFDENGNDADCYGVYLNKDQANVMMPYEYWDKTSTSKAADEQGKAYQDYCKSLGITPVFSGWDNKGKYHEDMDFTSYPGYWKVLIDRCMYNNDGTYHKQNAVNVKDADLDMLNSDKMREGIFKPLQVNNPDKTDLIAERSEKRIAEESKFSISPEMDADYMSAVNSGNMEEAQRLVDEAAKSAGYDIRAWHRAPVWTSSQRFTVFDPSYTSIAIRTPGWNWFSTDEDYIDYFGKSTKEHGTYKGFIKANNPLDVGNIENIAATIHYDFSGGYEGVEFTDDFANLAASINMEPEELYGLVNIDYGAENKDYDEFDAIGETYEEEPLTTTQIPIYAITRSGAFRELVEKAGYDSIKAVEGPEARKGNTGVTTYGIPYSSQFKSADPVTYAEDGSIIPLSERFDSNDDDIRYSLPTQDSDDNILSDGQMEFFKNSQARDEQGRLVPVYHGTFRGPRITVFDGTPDGYWFTPNQDVALDYTMGYEMGMLGALVGTERNPYDTDEEYFEKKGFAFSEDEEGNWSASRIDERTGREFTYSKTAESKEELMEMIYDDAETEDSFDSQFSLRDYYPCYLNLENPKVIECNGTYCDDVNGTGKTTREFAQEAMSEGYDSIIFRNIVDPLEEMDVYVAFSSNQIKDIRNLNPTENPDIRYSITDDEEAKSRIAYEDAMDNSYEALEHYEQLIDMVDPETYHIPAFQEENVARFYAALKGEETVPSNDPVLEEDRVRIAKSKEEFYNSLNAKWQDRWTTGGEVLDIKSVKTDIRNLVIGVMNNSDTSAKYRNDIVKKTLMDVRTAFQLMKQDETGLASYLLYHSAQRMIDNVEFYVDGTFDMYKDLKDYLRTARISLGEEYWSDVDYNEFRKRNFGRLKLVKGRTNVDKVYQELQEMWPEWFNEEEQMTPPDQLLQIEHVLDSIQPYKEAYSSEAAAELAFDIADDLYEIMAGGKEVRSLADTYKERYDAKTKAMKQRHAEAMLRMRKAKAEGVQAERAKWRAREAKRVDELTEKYEAKLSDLKAKQGRKLKLQQAKADFEIATLKQNREYNIQRLKAEKARAVKEERQRGKWREAERNERRRERAAHKTYFDRIQKTYGKLKDRLLSNTAESNIPEQYKKQLAGLLAAFDLQTESSKKREAKTGHVAQKTIKMAMIREALKNIEDKSDLFHVNDAITDIIDELMAVDGQTIDSLSAAELQNIDKLLRALLHEFNTYRDVRIGAKRQQAADLADAQVASALEHAKTFGPGSDYYGVKGWVDKLINMDEMTPAYMFKRIDPENVGLGLMWKEIRRSQDRYIKNTEQLNKWMDEIVGKYHNKGYGADTIEKWRSSNYTRTYNLENGTIALTPAQAMSLYCLSKRPQAYGHMVGAGVVVAPVSFQAKIMSDLKRKINRALPVILTDADIKTVVSTLTPEQIQIADQLQELMATKMADWGNEASMNVLGIKLFTEPEYFPIKSDKAALEKDLTNEQVENAIRNFGFTKAVQPGARNAIMVDDIFDVVTEHCNNMNLYNAYSETLNDFMKVYNKHSYQEDGADYSVAQAISHAYSQKATTFIMEFIRDLNGNTSRGRQTGIEAAYNDMLGKAKQASVFANLRVLAQQPTAITRAFAVIDPKYIKGIKIERGAMKEMFEHCPIALWKSWGYYDINMGKSIEDIIMNEGNWLEDFATQAYGAADNITWTAIWQMVKNEMKDTHPDVKVGTDEYWELCNERMSEIVDLTQVVDSPLHRSHAMRDKGIVAKTATAFMAEPTLTFNMFKDGIVRAKEAWIKGDKAEANKILGRTVAVFLFQAGTVAAAAALVDALRHKQPDKDDEDDRFLHLWWINTIENFKDNLKLWNNIYYVKDIASLFDGWGISNLGLQGFKYIADGYLQLTGNPYVKSSKTWYENMAYGFGYMTGIPTKTIMTGITNAFKWFGIEVPGIKFITEPLDNLGKEPSKSSDKSSDKKTAVSVSTEDKWYDYGNNPITVKDGSPLDELLNHFGMNLTAAEKKAIAKDQQEQAMQDKAKDINEKYADLSGSERDKKVWSAVSTYFKDEDADRKSFSELVADGDYVNVNRMRRMYLNAGGDLEYFNERVMKESKSALKKSIKYDQTEREIEAQANIKDYLLRNGLSEDELSEIVYKSDTAKDVKVAMRLNDDEALEESLIPLINAGLTYDDYERLWDNRNRMKLSSYKGRYKDRLKSTGAFIWPTQGTITSHFGYRDAPTAGASSNHPAIDIGAAEGTDVVAADGGTVIYAGWNSGYGNSVGIQHDNGMVTYYNHLSSYNVNVGDSVSQGQLIAAVGSTGISTGPHLDFKILDKDGNPVDPEQYLS